MKLPDDYHCFWCGAEYHTCPTNYRGDCLQRTPEIVAGDFAYNQGAKAVVVEHIPTTTIVGRYPTLQAAKKAVAAGHYIIPRVA